MNAKGAIKHGKKDKRQYGDLINEQRVAFNNYFRKIREKNSTKDVASKREKTWQEFWAQYYGIEKYLRMTCKLASSKRLLLLDLGCGDGKYSRLLYSLNKNINITAVDISEEALKRAKSNLVGTGARLIKGDMGNLPFSANSFDVLLIIDALHHYPHFSQVIKEAHRVLRKNGYMLIAEPLKDNVFANFAIRVWDWMPKYIKHKFLSNTQTYDKIRSFRFSFKELDYVLNQYNFHVVSLTHRGLFLFVINWFCAIITLGKKLFPVGLLLLLYKIEKKLLSTPLRVFAGDIVVIIKKQS
jgi:ubiquinone/menaquinone biosynthesis C-methylase UbiE